jgi:hypothetical protein
MSGGDLTEILGEVIQARRGGSGQPMREAKEARRGIAPAERVPPGVERPGERYGRTSFRR